MSAHQPSRPVTVRTLANMKQKGEKIAMLTAYDYPFARLLDDAGTDVLLVGDSLGQVVQGKETTLPVTLDELIYHGQMVRRGAQRAMVVVDLPFPLAHMGPQACLEAAARVMKETGCEAVKLETTRRQAETVAALVDAGIPVMAHAGLRPQSVHSLGGYRVQRNEASLLEDAKAVTEAGAFSIVLECIPTSIASRITREISIPTIGIGAGPDCDGQVLVLHDLLGLSDRRPKFARAFADVRGAVMQAAKDYNEEVRNGAFPAEGESYE